MKYISESLTLGKSDPGTHWIGGWVDSRTGLDDLEKRKFLTRSQSLYRLRYVGIGDEICFTN
jgi:hypothetical protein